MSGARAWLLGWHRLTTINSDTAALPENAEISVRGRCYE